MLGEPHPQTTYLVASIIHPDYLDYLRSAKIKLFHILFHDKDWYGRTPPNEWIITGGQTVGPRAIKMARLMGYTNIHLFGFDGSGKHAGPHTNEQPEHKFRKVRIHGKEFFINENMILQAQTLFQELNTLPNVNITFHGEGFLQEMAKDWTYRFQPGYPLAVVRGE